MGHVVSFVVTITTKEFYGLQPSKANNNNAFAINCTCLYYYKPTRIPL